MEGSPRRIGILGSGCGTLAAYRRHGVILRSPEVSHVAQSEFTYLHDTPSRLELALGDAHLVLESEVQPAIRSFGNGCLCRITREAFRDYFRHLKTGGIVAVNISNSYLNLQPVTAAPDFGKAALLYRFTPEEDDLLCSPVLEY